MNQSNQDTDDILNAIKSMMSNDQRHMEQELPKDIIELTEPLDEKQNNENDTSILELTELVSDQPDEKIKSEINKKNDLQISKDHIRNAVRSAIELLPQKTINNII